MNNEFVSLAIAIIPDPLRRLCRIPISGMIHRIVDRQNERGPLQKSQGEIKPEMAMLEMHQVRSKLLHRAQKSVAVMYLANRLS